MTSDFDLKRLKGLGLFVGTPMYDGRCCADFAFSIAQLTGLCVEYGVDLHFNFFSHEALVEKARNEIVDAFLCTGHRYLIFIDADIGFDARDVLRLLALQVLDETERVMDVIAAPYPLKRLSWDLVLRAAKAGLADEDPDRLARYSSGISVHPAQPVPFAIDRPLEVMAAGTGFMLIRRDTFERLRAHWPDRAYPATARHGADAPAPKLIHAFFETEIDGKQRDIPNEVRAFLDRFPQATHDEIRDFLDSDAPMGASSGHHLSEDYAFCRKVRASGMKVWLCPWIELAHTGSHRFTSRLADLAAIGAV